MEQSSMSWHTGVTEDDVDAQVRRGVVSVLCVCVCATVCVYVWYCFNCCVWSFNELFYKDVILTSLLFYDDVTVVLYL